MGDVDVERPVVLIAGFGVLLGAVLSSRGQRAVENALRGGAHPAAWWS